jgi:tetratricopeptide (TPR) repeat protein
MGKAGRGNACQKGSKMSKFQKSKGKQLQSILMVVLVACSAAKSKAAPAEQQRSELQVLEEAIFDGDWKSLPGIEVKVAKLLQENPTDVSANYLMSTILLKMFTLDPGSYSLIRQSTELAAQTYDLDRKSDLSIAALANILEVSGETERGLELISDASKRGIRQGWRTKLAKARLLYDGKNSTAVLKVIEEALAESDVSQEIVAPTLIAAITSSYHGEEQINQLNLWRKKCGVLEMDLAVANSRAINAQYEKAMSDYEKIIAQHPDNGEALLSSGIIALGHKKNPKLAIKLFKQAIQFSKNENDKVAAETHLALTLIGQKTDSSDVRTAAVKAISDAGDREAVLITILSSYRKNQGIPATIHFLENLQEGVPGMHLAHALKGELLSEKLGKHLEATRDFTDAITLEPGRSEYYNGRGLAWMNMSNLEAALSDFQTAIATNPSDASAQYNIACAQARLGLKNEAKLSLAKALELDERLASNAKTDKDFSSLQSDPEFQVLIGDSPKVFSVAH